tara:strand:+ start:287 stop:604 length:318 start_codon:yes stop_codon:yes gene_type:complete
MTIDRIAANQTVLTVGDVTVLFSYQTPVAAFNRATLEKFAVDPSTLSKPSRTTAKHVSMWLKSYDFTIRRYLPAYDTTGIPKESGIPADKFRNLIHNEIERQAGA